MLPSLDTAVLWMMERPLRTPRWLSCSRHALGICSNSQISYILQATHLCSHVREQGNRFGSSDLFVGS